MKNIVIIGGSSGIGAATVKAFIKQGDNVVFSYCNGEQRANDLVSQCSQEGQILEAIPLDVQDTKAIEAFVSGVESSFQKIDGIVYCSGIVMDDIFITMSHLKLQQVLNTNLLGCFYTVQGLFPMLNFKEGASIVAVSSTGGIRPEAGQTNYAASKAGLIGMMASLAREYARKKVRVNIVAPGFIDTEMVDQTNAKIKKAITEIPMGRLGTPSEVANVICFLSSDAASYITAQTIIVDGGRI